MKPSKTAATAHGTEQQPPSKKFPDHAQTEATSSRKEILEAVARVQAPRESKRPAERGGKSPSK